MCDNRKTDGRVPYPSHLTDTPKVAGSISKDRLSYENAQTDSPSRPLLRARLEQESYNLSYRVSEIQEILRLLTPEIEQTLEIQEKLKSLGIRY